MRTQWDLNQEGLNSSGVLSYQFPPVTWSQPLVKDCQFGVSPVKLLHKMKQYGVDGTINSCLCDFLTNRQMKVVVDGEESEAVNVDSGVPQGTVLGPLLFLCHTSSSL